MNLKICLLEADDNEPIVTAFHDIGWNNPVPWGNDYAWATFSAAGR